jgi:hypothetical protein
VCHSLEILEGIRLRDENRTVCLLTSVGAFAQTNAPTLFISPMEDGFEVYLSAAMHKKSVPVRVMTVEEGTAYTLKVAQIEVTKESTGGKIARCLFAYCAGISDKASTSVTLVSRSGEIVWSYSVNKGRGEKNRQSMAEAIAKHLKDDYLKKRR